MRHQANLLRPSQNFSDFARKALQAERFLQEGGTALDGTVAEIASSVYPER